MLSFLLSSTMAGGGGVTTASEAIIRRRALQGKSGWVNIVMSERRLVILSRSFGCRLDLCITDESLLSLFSLHLVDCKLLLLTTYRTSLMLYYIA